MADRFDAAGRAIAGLLGYSPGPGIYSRLERAIEAMPENVRVQELPGLLKRYKEGVPGWELKATNLDQTIAGRDAVPREELLEAVRQRSPVYTHGEVILGGRPQMRHVPTGGTASYYDADTGVVTRLPDPTRPEPDYPFPDRAGDASKIGEGVSHGWPRYIDYGQGGKDYAELLLTQPNLRGDYGSHWDADTPGVVAHARYDTHGDALRINELQSDLGIHNRKMREQGGAQMTYDAPPQLATESDADYANRLEEMGFEIQWMDDGNLAVGGRARERALPFPLEDAWADILIKRLALEAARGGHRAIEVASPRAIADKVGGNIDNYEHFYGKVVPGAIERLGRKMGGFADESSMLPASAGTTESRWTPSRQRLRDEIDDYEMSAGLRDLSAEGSYRSLVDAFENDGAVYPEADRLYRLLIRNEGMLAEEAAERMPELMSLAQRQARATSDFRIHNHNGIQYGAAQTAPPGRRYIMSDEMRKRILTQGIGAAVGAGLVTDGLMEGQQ